MPRSHQYNTMYFLLSIDNTQQEIVSFPRSRASSLGEKQVGLIFPFSTSHCVRKTTKIEGRTNPKKLNRYDDMANRLLVGPFTAFAVTSASLRHMACYGNVRFPVVCLFLQKFTQIIWVICLVEKSAKGIAYCQFLFGHPRTDACRGR